MAVPIELIKELRARTQASFADCRQALEETKGDLEEAVKRLRVRGAVIAEKRSGRDTDAGIVEAYIHSNSRVGVLVDLHFSSEDVVKEPGGDLTIPVKIIVEGDFANVNNFLEGLAKGRYLYVFEKLEGIGALPEGIRGKNKVTITAKLYAASE